LFGPCSDTVNAVTDICYRTPYSIKNLTDWIIIILEEEMFGSID